MTDRYENIRQALAMGPTQGPWTQGESAAGRSCVWVGGKSKSWIGCHTESNARYIAACDPDTIRALLAEKDALREALEVMVEMVEMNGFGRAYAMDVARAALAKKNSNDRQITHAPD